jgi:hypothetical protein
MNIKYHPVFISAADADKNSLLSLIHKNDRPGFKDRINYALPMGFPFYIHAKINSQTDEEITVSVEERVSKNITGALLFGTIKDSAIYNKHESENAITRKWNIDIPDGKIYLDKGWLNLFEFSGNPCEVDFNMWLDRLHPEDLSSAVSAYLKYLRGETEEYHDKFRLRTNRGGWKWVMAGGWITEKTIKAALRFVKT